jgi:hypothetical protein
MFYRNHSIINVIDHKAFGLFDRGRPRGRPLFTKAKEATSFCSNFCSCASLPSGGRRPTTGNLRKHYLEILRFLGSRKRRGSVNSHFFQVILNENGVLWLRIWTKACRGPFGTEKCLDLFKSTILYTRQPSLTAESQLSHSFCKNGGKYNQPCEPTIRVFSSPQTRQDQHVANSIFIACNEAYYHSLSLSGSSLLLSIPCWEGKPNGRRWATIRQFFSVKQ